MVLCACLGDAEVAVARDGAPDSIALATGAVPAPASLATIRTGAGERAVRVWVGRNDYFEFRHVRFDSSGAGFDRDDLLDASTWGNGDPPPLPSPIAWERIEYIQARHSNGRSGAVIGAVAGAAVVAVSVMSLSRMSDASSEDVLGVLGYYLPLGGIAGALAGSLLGQGFASWPVLWQRAPAR